MFAFCFIPGLLIAVGVALYPLGFGNKEVQDACEEQSGPYKLGMKITVYVISMHNFEFLMGKVSKIK